MKMRETSRGVDKKLHVNNKQDAAAYLAICNMSQSWKNHLKLFDESGNNGTIYGDEPAAMRYLEMRLSKNSEKLLLDGIDKGCVDFQKTFDDEDTEPVVLPAKLPMYLINGTFGISGGYQSNVPPHNPKEVITELVSYIKDKNHKINLRPDFPTGALVLNDDRLADAYKTGRSNYIMRAKIDKDEKKNTLIIRELPYMVTKNSIIEQLESVTTKKKDKNKKEVPAVIQSIKKIDDNSSGGDIEIIIECKKGFTLEQVETELYKYTSLQTTVPFIMIGIYNGKFKIIKNIKEIFEYWLDFRINTIKRFKVNNIKQWNYRIHIIDGLLKILNSKIIDQVIAKIKKLKTKKDVIEMLENDYDLTNKQATAVATLELYRLSNMSIEDLKNEKKDLNDKLTKELEYLRDNSKIEEYIIEEITEINKSIKCERKTQLIDEFTDINVNLEENIPDTECGIIITNQGYIKKRPKLKSQTRNGKGYTLGKMKENDYPVYIGNLKESDYLFVGTNAGKVYKFEVREFEETGNNIGTSIKSRINNEKIVAALQIPRNIDYKKYNILTVTKSNKIKLTNLEEFKNVYANGIIAAKLNENDSIVNMLLIDKDKESKILIAHSGGNTILISSNDIPVVGRTTYGSLAFSNDIIAEGHDVVSVDFLREDSTHIVTVTESGLGKIVDIEEFYTVKQDGEKKLQSRGTKGMMCTKLKDNDRLVSAKFCNKNEQLTIVSTSNVISIEIETISEYKRPTYGLALMKLNDGDKVTDITIP